MKKAKNWQIQLGAWGFIAWMAIFFNLEQINNHFNEQVYTTASAYILGLLTAFAGYLFIEVIQGNAKKILGYERGIWQYLYAFAFFSLLAIGFLGFYANITGSFPWYYNLGFWFAGFVVAQGLVPLIKYHDGE